ncbi:MAG: hypothetical protein K8R48_08470 [Alphaproteobacteria bacterium]|nr:hypothetical protein [Alphaproteobacteria bacterium]
MKKKEPEILIGIRNCVNALCSSKTPSKKKAMAQEKLEFLLWLAATPIKKRAIKEFPWLEEYSQEECPQIDQKDGCEIKNYSDNVIPFPTQRKHKEISELKANLLIMEIKRGGKEIEKLLEAKISPEITLRGAMFWDKEPRFSVLSFQGERNESMDIGNTLVFISSGLDGFDRLLQTEGFLEVEISGQVISRNANESFMVQPDSIKVLGG